MAVALVQHQGRGLSFELGGKRTSLLAHQTPLRGVELLLDLLVGARQDQAAARAAQGLVGGGGDHVGEGDRVW